MSADAAGADLPVAPAGSGSGGAGGTGGAGGAAPRHRASGPVVLGKRAIVIGLLVLLVAVAALLLLVGVLPEPNAVARGAMALGSVGAQGVMDLSAGVL